MLESLIGIFISTLVLEDAALAASLVFVEQGKITLTWAFMACFLGISFGDILIYAAGFIAARYQPLARRIGHFEAPKSLSYAIVISRVIPGTRLPTYFAAGIVGYPFWKFVWLTLLSVAGWVALALAGGRWIQTVFAEHWILALLIFFVFLVILRSLVPRLIDPWQRRALRHSWRKWLTFEFWPPWLFYLPIVGYYIVLSLRHRSFFLPFYSNPGIPHAGLVGESKWDFYQHIGSEDFRLNTYLLEAGSDRLAQVQKHLADGSLRYPFVLKPDVGQRGFAVRVIREASELEEYLNDADFTVLAQEFCDWEREAGIFYVRRPDQEHGHLFSITDKEFPTVTGNGVTSIGNLILRDRRARLMAATYFRRFAGRLDWVPAKDEVVRLATCGNHCQGAVFLNGHELKSEPLLRAIESVAVEIPGFYLGRFDVRYRTPESLMAGREFKIVEVNGASSEATHIWDANTRIWEAYWVLFQQWAHVFRNGRIARDLRLVRHPVSIIKLLRDLRYMKRGSKKLSTSS